MKYTFDYYGIIFVPERFVMSTLPRVAASVTLYNSEYSCIDAIETFQNQVELIYLIDNSEKMNEHLVTSILKWPNVIYVGLGENRGVATALNEAAQLAINAGFDYLLTMDDDTYLPNNAIIDMLRFIDGSAEKKIAITSGIYFDSTYDKYNRRILFTITSGSLLNLNVYRKNGPFRDDFFIDHIDHEYCLRLNKNKYQILEIQSIKMHHKLGQKKNFTNCNIFQFTSHVPLRIYYIMRNGLITASLYPSFRYRMFTIILKEIFKIILLEDQKIERTKLAWKGISDALSNRMGKFTN